MPKGNKLKGEIIMIFAKIKTADGHTESNLYWYWEALHADTFSSDSDVLRFLSFEISGKNYQERKESLRDLAIDFQLINDGDTDVQLSMVEIGAISAYFERMGRRYGLLREFRENAIC